MPKQSVLFLRSFNIGTERNIGRYFEAFFFINFKNMVFFLLFEEFSKKTATFASVNAEFANLASFVYVPI